MRKIPVIHRRATGGVEDCHGEALWWGHYTPSKCKRRFILLFCLLISIIFFIGDLEFDGEEWGFLLVFGGWAEEWMGLLGLHRSVLYWSVFFFFFGENMWVSVFSILGIFFLVGLPVTLLLLLFSDFSSKIFLDFFFNLFFIWECS